MNIVKTVCLLLAGLGAFMLGFKLMSDSLQAVSGKGMKRLFFKISDKPLAGIGIGMGATALVQSSSVTTVMVVGFVNAGVMTLYQAAAVIMGANIGTTITSQIAALESFDFITYAMALSAVGIFTHLFVKNERWKKGALAVAGLGLLFLGMRFMSDTMSIVKDSPTVIGLLSSVSNPFLLLLLGAAVTGLLQSSSAVNAIVISMANAGIIIGGSDATVYFLILGTNIGTCVTALLSSVGASANAKRASVIHLLFNVLGSVVFFVLLLLLKQPISTLFSRAFSHLGTRIAMFHTLFNVVSAILFFPFIKLLVKISIFIVRDARKKNESVNLDERLLLNPPVALRQVGREVVKGAFIALRSVNLALEGFYNAKDVSVDLNKLTGECLTALDATERYLSLLSTREAAVGLEGEIAEMYHIVSDVARVAEISDNIAKYTEQTEENNVKFSTAVFDSLRRMEEELRLLCEKSTDYLLYRRVSDFNAASNAEQAVDDRRKALLDDHVLRVKEGVCSPFAGATFVKLVSDLERAGDHLFYISSRIRNNHLARQTKKQLVKKTE